MTTNLSSNKDISQIATYQSGIAQASAHRILNRITSDFLLQYGLTTMQWFVVGVVYDAGENGIRLSDLMRKLGTTLPYITNTIALLESKGMIKKVSHTGDSRIKLVSIQPDYLEEVKLIEDGLRAHIRQTLYHKDGISRDELQAYIAVLYKIVNNASIS